ncbi:hypothetical protein PI124_g8341 [Phytophthora idaei]|nr:hypothetical protein PI125_g5228 [Phytophthora idaei]KAG3164596.1 hypothetical protein PI126_g5026 [Phytophthora idaei]KAG3246954.1 hypothetical protein PI124_g8341 [Phytophthora idaei]
MDGRTAFAGTGVDQVTLPDDAEVLAETAHTLYDEKQPEGKNILADVVRPQLSVVEDEEAYFADRDSLDLHEDIGEYGESKEKPLVAEVSDNRGTMALELHDISRDFNMLIEYFPGSASGIPTDCNTLRIETVKQFYNLLFPEDGNENYHRLLWICAPPMSGKTAMFIYSTTGCSS